jgi:hypothetical protein
MKEINSLESMKNFLNSEEGKKSIQKFADQLIFKYKLKDNNVLRIKKMFNDQKSFNLLVNKIINKHTKSWTNRCYEKGIEPHPFELLYTLFDLAEKEGKIINPIDDLTKNFNSTVYSYKSWQFAITQGQGAVCSVYYRKKLKYRG